MIKNHLVIIPFNLPWDWSTDYLNQTAFILSKNNVVLCYMWADSLSLKEYLVKRKIPRLIKKLSKNLYLIYPLYLIPFRRIEFVSELNTQLNIIILKIISAYFTVKNKNPKKLLWIFYPKLVNISDLFGSNYYLIYDCVDYFVSGTKKEKKEIENNQKVLLKRADLVIANSQVLQKYLKKWRKEVYLVPQGFRLDFFKTKISKSPMLEKSKPVIGFVGAISYRLDFDLLIALARRNPKWNFVIWGPVLDKEKMDKKTFGKMQTLLKLSNVKHGSSKDKKEIPGIINQFDIAMIPYDSSQDFNKYCYPMKLFEYFYIGLPVISTPIEELKRFPKFVKIGKNIKEWEKHIAYFISKPWPRKNKIYERKLAIANSWDIKIEEALKFFD